MAWIKRNLFFVVGGVIALALLGAAGFYIYQAWNRNATAFTDLNEVVGNLKNLTDQKPSPGNEKTDNTQIARDQDKQLKDWMASAADFFQPIPSIPPAGSVGDAAFSSALQNTVNQLQHEADAAGVILPPKYAFSFSAEKDRVTFSPGGLSSLATQLGEVKFVSEILFATRINAFDGIQRVRVSDDDTGGQSSTSDYTDQSPVTNDLAIITPYIITFRCFTPELAQVMTSFATASNACIIKSVNLQPAGANSLAGADQGMGAPPPGMPMFRGGYMSAPPAAAQPVPGKGGLQTILKEQLLSVTAEVGLVKLLPKN